MRIALLAGLAFLIGSPAWATSSSCSSGNSSAQHDSDGCGTTNNQFSNVQFAGTSSILSAGTLTFENTNVFAYQQTENSPCIYDNSSCNNGTFPSLVLSGDTNKDNVVSESYSVQQLLNVLTVPTFFVGVDSNDTGTQGNQLLVRFDMYVNGTLTYTLGGGCNATLANSLNCNAGLDYHLLDGNNPGNGYSDDLIRGFSLAGLNSTDTVQFVMSEHADVAGREQFFLIGDVPEPATFGLLGGALALLGLLALRRGKLTA